MLDFDHYNKLKEASIVPNHIREMFGNGSKLGKLLVELYLPAIRVAIHAATHETKLFSDLLEKMNNAQNLPPYFHKRLLYKELYRSLGLLGDDCLAYLLSELDCSDSVFNSLHDSVINQDPDAFEKVMQGWDGSFSQVTPICSLLFLELFINDAVEWIIKEANRIDEITDLNQQNQEGVVFLRKAFDVVIRRVKEVFSDEFVDGLDKRFDKTFEEYLDETLKRNDAISDSFNEGFVRGALATDPNFKFEAIEKAPEEFFYKVLLIAYHFLNTETSISQPAGEVIKEILFVPEYETIWKQYEGSDSIDHLLEEIEPIVGMQPTPQIEESAAEEVTVVPRRSQNASGERGRHKDSWIKGRSQIGEEQIGALIQRDIWDSLVGDVNKLEFKKNVAGKARETKVKNFSAALLYYALEKNDWARVFTESGVQSSFCKRTMKFAHIARSSFITYITKLHDWYHMADAIKDSSVRLQSFLMKCQTDNADMAFLIFKNLSKIGSLIEKYEVKLKKTLDENCKL